MPNQDKNKALIYNWITSKVRERSRVLDLGCGDGELLGRLVADRRVEGTGVEISQEDAIKAIRRGLSVHHGDAEEALCHYPDAHFDYVILSLAVQELSRPLEALKQCLRVGRQVIVVFPCFGHWKLRWQLAALGRAPITLSFPHPWYSSPNRHYLTVADWDALCHSQNWRILDRAFLAGGGRINFWPNLRAEVGTYLLTTRLNVVP